MSRGFQIEVFGDSSLFAELGKGVSYLVRADDAGYLIDCGATPFRALGHEGVKNLKGLIATHSHEDHRRWFTDLVLYLHYQPDLRKRLRLITSEAIQEEYEKNSKGALERSLSADRRQVVDVPYSEFVEKTILGPRAKYRIEQRPPPRDAGREGEGLVWRVVETATGEVVPPSRAKVVVNPLANRPRMLFKDPEADEWVEPESYYPFTSTTFYEAELNDFVDEETGLRFRAVKAPTWHGPPTIGVLIERGEDRAAFSSDTVYDPGLWRELAETVRPVPPEVETDEFRMRHVVEGDINEYIQRVWGRERYEEAMRCYRDAIVFHDADFEQSVVHTSHSKLERAEGWRRLILTHTPDGFASIFPITCTGKRYAVVDGDIFEAVGGRRLPIDADLYFKTEDGTLLVGYRSDVGSGRLWETPRGLTVEIGHDRPPRSKTPSRPKETKEASPGEAGPGGVQAPRLLGRYELFFDLGGRYFPAKPVFEGRGTYRERSDGRIELITETPDGSKASVVEDCRLARTARAGG